MSSAATSSGTGLRCPRRSRLSPRPFAAPESHGTAPPADVPDEDVSAGLRIPPGIDMSTTSVDPASVDLAWFDRYTTGEVPIEDGVQEPARPPAPDEDR